MTVIAGRYELGRALGSGAMSDVVAARDLVLGRQVAVKLFRPGVDPARVRAEVRVHARLSHPGLVEVFDSGTDEQGRTYLVLQLVDGPTLAARLRQAPLTPTEATRIGRGLADALAHLHARGVVHRDVKPANVLIAADGTPRLADLGIAQEQGQEALTATGFTLGTVPYLSPEQVRGRTATPASDVYALGLVLLEALTGRREYPGMTAEGALARLTRPPVVDAHLPAPWPALLGAMTADDPVARPTAEEVAAVLDGRGALPPVAPLPPTEPVALPVPEPVADHVPAQRRAAASRHHVKAVAVAAVLALGAAGLAAAGPGDPPAAPVPSVRSVEPVAVETAPRPRVVAPTATPSPTARVRTAATRTATSRPTPTAAPTRTTTAPSSKAPRAKKKRDGRHDGKGDRARA